MTALAVFLAACLMGQTLVFARALKTQQMESRRERSELVETQDKATQILLDRIQHPNLLHGPAMSEAIDKPQIREDEADFAFVGQLVPAGYSVGSYKEE